MKMKPSEITKLRKSGQLAEALEAAEHEYELAANEFTARALFWCLADLAKKERDMDRLAELRERMAALRADHIPDDEFMDNTLAFLANRLDPKNLELRQAVERSKRGEDTQEVYEKYQEMFDNGQLGKFFLRDFGWLLYHNLHAVAPDDVQRRKQLIHNFLKLEMPRPDLLYSLILNEAVAIEHDTPEHFRIRDFMNLWGWENLRDEDWRQFKNESGFMSSSLVEKLVGVYAKELVADRVAASDEFAALVDQALERFPNNQYMPLYKAYVLKSQGRNEEAMAYYRQLIQKTPRRGYLWAQAADLADDADRKIALLCKAIVSEREESFIGKSRLKLARLLLENGMAEYAKQELEKHRSYYNSQGWTLSNDFRSIERAIPGGTAAMPTEPLFDKYLPLAEEFVYAELPAKLVVKAGERLMDDRHNPGKKYVQWTLRNAEETFQLRYPGRLGLDVHAPDGTLFDVRLSGDRIVWAKPAREAELPDWLKRGTGTVQLRTDRNGRTFTIIDEAYVPDRLLAGAVNGQELTVTSLRQPDGRWSAIAVVSE